MSPVLRHTPPASRQYIANVLPISILVEIFVIRSTKHVLPWYIAGMVARMGKAQLERLTARQQWQTMRDARLLAREQRLAEREKRLAAADVAREDVKSHGVASSFNGRASRRSAREAAVSAQPDA